MVRRSSERKIETKKIGRSFEVTVNGKAAHASTPEKGINAISVLFSLLNKFEFAEDSVADFISFYDFEKQVKLVLV